MGGTKNKHRFKLRMLPHDRHVCTRILSFAADWSRSSWTTPQRSTGLTYHSVTLVWTHNSIGFQFFCLVCVAQSHKTCTETHNTCKHTASGSQHQQHKATPHVSNARTLLSSWCKAPCPHSLYTPSPAPLVFSRVTRLRIVGVLIKGLQLRCYKWQPGPFLLTAHVRSVDRNR